MGSAMIGAGYVGLGAGAYLADLDLRDIYPVGTMKALDFRYVCVGGEG